MTSIFRTNLFLIGNKTYPSSTVLSECYTNFIKAISGYHSINDHPIRGLNWESIHKQIIQTSSNKDNNLSELFEKVQCHSSIYDKNSNLFRVSSHHLHSTCSLKCPGNIPTIVDDIHSRNDIDFHSILVRNWKDNTMRYDWYLFPNYYQAFNPYIYNWSPKIATKGKHKHSYIGWKTNVVNGSSMSIFFNMSSQLWINIAITDECKKYKVASTIVNKYNKYNYIELHNNLQHNWSKPLFRSFS